MSVALQVTTDTRGLQRLATAINRLTEADTHELLDYLGALGVSQTQHRIAVEKTAPDGTPWKPLDPGYAARKRGSGGILELEGDLLISIDHQVGAGFVMWGSPLEYAALQQLGGTPDMPPGPAAVEARPYLGLSDANVEEAQMLIGVWLDILIMNMEQDLK
ncbi:MAG: phage virion morphogenesis protein [Pseudomonadota bacterium]